MKATMEGPITIQVLIGRAQQGDGGAFSELVAAQRDGLDRYVRLRLGSHLHQKVELEDVLQESFVQAFQSIKNFQWLGEKSFLEWLKGITEHVILELARKDRQARLYYLDSSESTTQRFHRAEDCGARSVSTGFKKLLIA